MHLVPPATLPDVVKRLVTPAVEKKNMGKILHGDIIITCWAYSSKLPIIIIDSPLMHKHGVLKYSDVAATAPWGPPTHHDFPSSCLGRTPNNVTTVK